jgi:hypothetical protein
VFTANGGSPVSQYWANTRIADIADSIAEEHRRGVTDRRRCPTVPEEWPAMTAGPGRPTPALRPDDGGLPRPSVASIRVR